MRVSCAFGSLQELEMLAYTYTSFPKARRLEIAGVLHAQFCFCCTRCADNTPIDRRGAARRIWPRAQEPQTTDLVADASRAEREERHT